MRAYLTRYLFLIIILFVIYMYLAKHQDVLQQEVPYNDSGILESQEEEIMDFSIKSQFQQKILNYAKDGVIIMTITDYFYLDLALNLHYSLQKLKIINDLIACMHRKACEELKRRHIQ